MVLHETGQSFGPSLTVGVLTGLGASLTVGVLTGLAASLTVGVLTGLGVSLTGSDEEARCFVRLDTYNTCKTPIAQITDSQVGHPLANQTQA